MEKKKTTKLIGKLIAKKLRNVYPTRKEMKKLAESLEPREVDLKICGKYDFRCHEFKYASYYQYLILVFGSRISKATVELSTLPYDEVCEALEITEDMFRENTPEDLEQDCEVEISWYYDILNKQWRINYPPFPEDE